MKHWLVILTLIGLAGALATVARAEGDSVAGEESFKSRCLGCHEHSSKGNALGASLVGVIGRKAGTLPRATFSRALTESDIIWDEKSLDEYIASSSKKVPWTLMSAHAIPSPKERADIIAYLKTLR